MTAHNLPRYFTTLTAGNTYNQIASDVISGHTDENGNFIASGDVSITAKDINIEAGYDTYGGDSITKSKQSGILAGNGGYNINVTNDTSLIGGIITSTQSAEDNGLNSFSTGTLIASNIDNFSRYDGDSFGISGGVSYSSANSPTDNQTTNNKSDTYTTGVYNPDSSGVSKSIGYGSDSDSQTSTTYSGINTSNITITGDNETLNQVQGDDSGHPELVSGSIDKNIQSDDITKLNRNTDNLTKELYSGGVSSDVSATIDMRMFTSDGRKDIKEDIYRSGEFIDATAEVITNEGNAGEQGFFTHTGNVNDNIEVNKQFTNMEEGKYALILNNLDSATPEQKQEALNAYALVYSNVTGVSIENALVIATTKFIGGASHDQKGTNTIYINDESQNNALDYIGNATHELTHGQIDQGLLNDLGDEKNEAYANLMGEHGSDNFEWAYGSSQYTIGSALNYGDINAHIDNDKSTLIADNNQQFLDVLRNDGENVDYSLIPGAAEFRWSNTNGVSYYEELKIDAAQDARIMLLATKKVYNQGADAVNMVMNLPSTIEFLFEHPEELRKLPKALQAAVVGFAHDMKQGSVAIQNGLVSNDPKALEAQAQAESTLLANLATTFIGAGVGKITVVGGKVVVKEVAKSVDNALDIKPGGITGAGEAGRVVDLIKLRQLYKNDVTKLNDYAEKMLAQGASKEQVAITLNNMRRELGIKYKNLTSPEERKIIYERNLIKYGDKYGPTIEYLINHGKSWDEIIESSTRPGGQDLGF